MSGNLAGTAASNLYLHNSVLLNVSALETGAAIGISTGSARAFSNATDKDYSSFFTSDSTALGVITQDGKLTLTSDTHRHNLCADSACTDHKAEDWSPWDKTDSLPTSGQYYLTKDVTLSEQVKTTGNLKLCLNGHTVTATNGARHIMVGLATHWI